MKGYIDSVRGDGDWGFFWVEEFLLFFGLLLCVIWIV